MRALLGFLLLGVAYVSQPAAEPLTASRAGDRAVATSSELVRSAATVAGAVADAKAIQLARVPRLSAETTYTRLSELDPVQLAPGIAFAQPTTSLAATAELIVPISDYALTFPALVRAARAGVSATEAARLAAARSVRAQAQRAFYEWLRAQMHVTVAEQFSTQVRATETQVVALVKADRASRADALALQAQVLAAEQAVATARHGAAVRTAQLRIIIDAPETEELVSGESLPTEVAAPNLPPLEDQVAAALVARDDVRTLDKSIVALAEKREASGTGRFPRLVAFGQVDYANPNQRVFPVVEEFKFTWAAGLSLRWNLSDALDAGAKLDKAQAEIDEFKAMRSALADGVRLELVAARGQLALAHSAMVVSRQRVEAAAEAMRVRKALLDAGRATVMETVAAQTQLTEAETSLINARIDWQVAQTDFAYASGQPLETK